MACPLADDLVDSLHPDRRRQASLIPFPCPACGSGVRVGEDTPCEVCTQGLTPEQALLARRPVVLRALAFHVASSSEIVVTATDIVTMGELIAHILSDHLRWPPDFVEFVVLREVFVHRSRLAARSQRLLRTLDVGEGGALRIAVVVRPPPESFPYRGREGEMVYDCMCSFSSCCRPGRAGRCSHGPSGLAGYCTGCGRPPGTLCSRCEHPCQSRPPVPLLWEDRECSVLDACFVRRT